MPPSQKSLLIWLVLQPGAASNLRCFFSHSRPLQVRGYPNPARHVRDVLSTVSVSPFAGSGLPESYKTRARSAFSSCLTLCRFGAARVLQDTCEITCSVQCRFGATRFLPEDSFFRSWIDYALCYHVGVYANTLFYTNASLSQSWPGDYIFQLRDTH